MTRTALIFALLLLTACNGEQQPGPKPEPDVRFGAWGQRREPVKDPWITFGRELQNGDTVAVRLQAGTYYLVMRAYANGDSSDVTKAVPFPGFGIEQVTLDVNFR